jgi:hypothetical protein
VRGLRSARAVERGFLRQFLPQGDGLVVGLLGHDRHLELDEQVAALPGLVQQAMALGAQALAILAAAGTLRLILPVRVGTATSVPSANSHGASGG